MSLLFNWQHLVIWWLTGFSCTKLCPALSFSHVVPKHGLKPQVLSLPCLRHLIEMLLPYITPTDVPGRRGLWQFRWDIAAASDQQGAAVLDLSTFNFLLEISVLWVGVCSLWQIVMAGS